MKQITSLSKYGQSYLQNQGARLSQRRLLPALIVVLLTLFTPVLRASFTYYNDTLLAQTLSYRRTSTVYSHPSTPIIQYTDLTIEIVPKGYFACSDETKQWPSGTEYITYSILSTTPIAAPAAKFSADTPNVTLGQTITIRVDIQLDPLDSLVQVELFKGWNSFVNSTDPATLHFEFPFAPEKPGVQKFGYSIHSKLNNVVDYEKYSMTVDNVYPIASMQGAKNLNVNDPISLTFGAENPISLAGYKVGFRIMEQRGTSGSWTTIHEEAVDVGNRSWTGDLPAPTAPGLITYRVYSWNQWMGEYDNLKDFTVTVSNRGPSVDITPNTTQTISFGQSVSFSSTATDQDGNLSDHTMVIVGPDEVKTSLPQSASGDTSMRSDVFTPSNSSGTVIGAWTIHYECVDALGAMAHTNDTTMQVKRATPAGVFADRAWAEGTPLPASFLNAVFTNPYNVNLSAPGACSYAIVAGGVAPYIDGRALVGGENLPEGTYTIRATIPSSTCYEAASVDATFTVSSDLNSDLDHDSLDKGTELELGMDPNTAAVKDANTLKFKINTPRK